MLAVRKALTRPLAVLARALAALARFRKPAVIAVAVGAALAAALWSLWTRGAWGRDTYKSAKGASLKDAFAGAGGLSGEGGGWKCATATVFESYPTTQDEKDNYSGDKWAGMFAGVSGKQSREWVASKNIVAVHSRDFPAWKGKTMQIRDPGSGRTLEVQVLDECSDKDCKGCCTENANHDGCGFLIDIEVNTLKRFLGKGGTDFQKKILYRAGGAGKPAGGSSSSKKKKKHGK